MKYIMFQGTSSNAGKTLTAAALCNLLSRKGYRVTPFKSQNMSLNSYTTIDDDEMSIAQVMQAEAAGIEPNCNMNPILLKPKEDFTSQVIVRGKPAGNMRFDDYQNNFRGQAITAIKSSLEYLKEDYDITVIEGAGSPAEINMYDKDLANMLIARMTNADVILVADIDQGGVFAAIVGTYFLIPEEDRKLIKAIIINKFRGNADVLKSGIDKIEELTNIPVIGIIPFDETLNLPEEDSASLSTHHFSENEKITIGTLRLPRISNFTDIDPLDYEEDVGIKLVNIYDKFDDLDALVIPGTRNTVNDIEELKKSGAFDYIREVSKEIPIFGICGGYQMLSKKIIDSNCSESKYGSVDGLGLLDIKTEFGRIDKVVKQSRGTILEDSALGFKKGTSVTGYELHEGITILKNTVKPFIKVEKGNGNDQSGQFDGAIKDNICGTYFHGIFHNFEFRRNFTDHLRINKGLEPIGLTNDDFKESKRVNYNQLGDLFANNVDMSFFEKLLND
ncbi:cobyric acid synthase CobQ [Methanosphaera sp. WGK6]|uniref:cobyric acid synthase CobQ n=1 Tax=Methanosphaera sp. WGK6 TaxID=1561964 RepID=UPI00084CE497|nr:cobyric acid synthase CobQ [Methanosphaera sp. WGK6]OED30700.1 cobalamin biosynthesis protein CobQ [Methanosphaera sp. WGK6]